MTEVTEFTIKRSEWLRGEGNSVSRLLRSTDLKRCCVGIYARACGIPDPAIIDMGWPNVGSERINGGFRWRVPETHWLAQLNNLAGVNDDEGSSSGARESTIAAIFAKHGITVTFED